jgi:hypothetical protein
MPERKRPSRKGQRGTPATLESREPAASEQRKVKGGEKIPNPAPPGPIPIPYPNTARKP